MPLTTKSSTTIGHPIRSNEDTYGLFVFSSKPTITGSTKYGPNLQIVQNRFLPCLWLIKDEDHVTAVNYNLLTVATFHQLNNYYLPIANIRNILFVKQLLLCFN